MKTMVSETGLREQLPLVRENMNAVVSETGLREELPLVRENMKAVVSETGLREGLSLIRVLLTGNCDNKGFKRNGIKCKKTGNLSPGMVSH